MSGAVTTVEDLQAIVDRAAGRQAAPDGWPFSTRALVWLALPPFWSLKLAEKGFPLEETGENFAKGEKVRELFEQLERAGWIVKEHEADSDDVIYMMPARQKTILINEIVQDRLTSKISGLSYLQTETEKISKFISSKLKQSNQAPSFVLDRWLQLAHRANYFGNLSNFFTRRIDDILRQAREAGSTSAPEALRWLEIFAPFVDIFGNPLEVALTRARREYEIFNRRAYDKRFLDNKYLVRREQDDIFTRLLNTPDEEDAAWALHYIGMGGMGKTMLMRHLNSELAEQNSLAVARVDFDYLNPDYPARQPGLLLLGFAVELSAYLGGSRGFQKFEKLVQEWHRTLAKGSGQTVDINQDELDFLVEAFAGELKRLPPGMRPLLILDTCEELAKLRPDGRLPASVQIMFEMLEKIHQKLPRLRVIFSGRRLLARQGCGWRLSETGLNSPFAQLPERNYLMLHEIRGFDKIEADEFLGKYKNGAVPGKFFEAVRSRSLLAEKAAGRLFIFDGEKAGPDGSSKNPVEPESPEDIRYNPFELDIYAAWLAEKPDLEEKDLAEGVHFYVKERIVDRVNENLKKRLPAIALLGRYDRALLKKLWAEDAPDRFESLFEELISQEWIDTERGASSFPAAEPIGGKMPERGTPAIWAMQDYMRARLLAYYREEEEDSLKAASQQVAGLLEELTLNRDWSELSVAYFESAAQILTELNKTRAADWWEKVEAKLALTGRWDWAHSLTNHLLADEEVAGKKIAALEQSPAAESVLRPAILATHAAALIHLKMPDIRPVWEEVSETLHRHPTETGRRLLHYRARLGKIAAPYGTGAPDIEAELKDICADESTLIAYPQLFASVISAIEEVTENYEGIYQDKAEIIVYDDFIEHAARFSQTIAGILLKYRLQAPPELICFLQSLCGRMALLEGNLKWAEECFDDSLKTLTALKELPPQMTVINWLDWRGPDDFAARIYLEYLRGTTPRFQTPEAAREKTRHLDFSRGTIDGDRLAAAISILSLDGQSRQIFNGGTAEMDRVIDRQLSVSSQLPVVNAHRKFPPMVVALLENKAMSGRLSAVIDDGRGITQSKNAQGNPFLQNETEKMMARLAFRFRLNDERSLGFGQSLNPGIVNELKIITMLEAASGKIVDPFTILGPSYFGRPSDPFSKLIPVNIYGLYEFFPKFHYGYRTCAKVLDSRKIKLGFGNEELLPYKLDYVLERQDDIKARFEKYGAGFSIAAVHFDKAECELREQKGGISSEKDKKLKKSIKETEAARDYAGAFTLDVLYSSLTAQQPKMHNAEQIGLWRAASILLEEGMLLAIRRPKAAFTILKRAACLFSDLNDFTGQILADLSLGLLAIKLNDRHMLAKALLYLPLNYAKLVQIEKNLPIWSELTACINDAILGEKRDVIFGFLNGQTKNHGWRPILVRLLYCLAWEKASSLEDAAVSHLRAWISENYGRIEEKQMFIPSDFDFEQDFTAGETGLSEIELMITKSFSTNFNLLSDRRVDMSLLMPGTNTNEETLKSTAPAEPGSVDTSYLTQSKFLPAAIREALRKEINESSEDLLSLKLSLTDPVMAAAPWEAILAFSAAEIEGEYYPRFLYRRVIDRAYRPHSGAITAPARALIFAPDNSAMEEAHRGWNVLATKEKILFEAASASRAELPVSSPACLLHLIGMPAETDFGINLEIISTDFEAADVVSSMESIDPRHRTIINAASLTERFPALRLVVVQFPPRLEEPRTSTDRLEIARMRQFCAEVFQAGVGAVIMLPFLNPKMSYKCLDRLARLLADPLEVRIEDLMQTMRENQEMIAENGASKKGEGAEPAFDLCLYLHDNFEWHIEQNHEQS